MVLSGCGTYRVAVSGDVCPLRCKKESRFLSLFFCFMLGASDLKPSSMRLCLSAMGGSALYACPWHLVGDGC